MSNLDKYKRFIEDLAEAIGESTKTVHRITLDVEEGKSPELYIEKRDIDNPEEVIQLVRKTVWGEHILPSEYLYAFVAWLTASPAKFEIGATSDCAVWAKIVEQFCKANELVSPRDDYPNHIVYPKITVELSESNHG